MNKKDIENFLKLNNFYNKSNKLEEIKESNSQNSIFKYGKYIIKISKNSKNLEIEFNALKKIKNKLIPAPFLYKKYNNKYILIIKKLRGNTLDRLWQDLTIKEKKNIIFDLVKNLKRINKIENKNGFLIHNDLWYKNILLFGNKLSGIIDFEISKFGKLELEFYKILNHKFTALNYMETNPYKLIEMEFWDLLLKEINKNYKKLYKDITPESFYNYNIEKYKALLLRKNEKWFKQEDADNFKNKYCNLKNCEKILRKFL